MIIRYCYVSSQSWQVPSVLVWSTAAQHDPFPGKTRTNGTCLNYARHCQQSKQAILVNYNKLQLWSNSFKIQELQIQYLLITKLWSYKQESCFQYTHCWRHWNCVKILQSYLSDLKSEFRRLYTTLYNKVFEQWHNQPDIEGVDFSHLMSTMYMSSCQPLCGSELDWFININLKLRNFLISTSKNYWSIYLHQVHQSTMTNTIMFKQLHSTYHIFICF